MNVFFRLLILLVFFALLGAPIETAAQEQGSKVDLGSEEIYGQSLKALTMLLVAAVLIENALAVLFNWRVFLTYFSLRGVKTIIAVVVSYVVVQTFNLDIIAGLLNAYLKDPVASVWSSQFLTALILSGGSAGVNNLMASLGYRDRGRDEEVNPRAPETKAWIAVRVERKNAVGPIHVHVSEVSAPATSPGAIAGTIGGRLPSLLELLLRNKNRFPQNGGYEVEPGTVYEIGVVAYDKDHNPIAHHLSGKQFRFAPHAIVDFEVTL